MMTGRDLIIYILENNLLDDPVFNDGKILGFMTIDEAAVKFGYGIETIKAWIQLNWVSCLIIDNTILIPMDAEI